MTNIQVITYNLLAPRLCNPSDFLNYPNPEDLDPKIRKDRTLLLLESFISKDSQKPIICLQEVAPDWKGDLELLFMNHNYSFFTISYGILGIGIAVPHAIKVTNVEYIHIGELIKTNSPMYIYRVEEEYREVERHRKITEENLTFLQKVSLYVKDMTALIPEYVRVIEETIKEAKWRKNYAIRVTLEASEKRFIVYNYHMPCTFKKPIIQFLHLSVFKRLILQHHDIPTIFAGDFNICQSSDEYNFFTGDQDLPESKLVYLPKEDQADISYLYFKMTTSPIAQFTCHSETKFGGYFKDTLDYIFVSNANIKMSGQLLETSEKMPNSVCPSDHLPIYANIDF